ncbi:hypothetical protein F7725_015060 [Dissostichus mawsoni]|uniref:Uncharacterized protein n=1 Tax=Dissostichus mawsoni TaxID=36200 RepID=A0A7J5YHD4_DISMA|nr:hypothetical protein F7725_015060 [Dissostichus mawsoni]
MAQVYRLYAGVLTALALCKYSLAGSHVTEASANQTVSIGNGDNGTESTTDTGQWTGHFSKCPEALTNYCIHGECRYIKEQNAPSCRCEYLDLDWRIGEKRQIIIACVIAGLVFLILLISEVPVVLEETKTERRTEEWIGEAQHDGDTHTVSIRIRANTHQRCVKSVCETTSLRSVYNGGISVLHVTAAAFCLTVTSVLSEACRRGGRGGGGGGGGGTFSG